MRQLQETWGQGFLVASLSAPGAGFVLATLVPFPVSGGKIWTSHGFAMGCKFPSSLGLCDISGQAPQNSKKMSVFIALPLTMFNILVTFCRIPMTANAIPPLLLVLIGSKSRASLAIWDMWQLVFPGVPRENQSLCALQVFFFFFKGVKD